MFKLHNDISERKRLFRANQTDDQRLIGKILIKGFFRVFLLLILVVCTSGFLLSPNKFLAALCQFLIIFFIINFFSLFFAGVLSKLGKDSSVIEKTLNYPYKWAVYIIVVYLLYKI